MKVKIISVDTTSNFFHNLTSALDSEVANWTQHNPDVNLISVTPSLHNVVQDEDNVSVMVATIIYD